MIQIIGWSSFQSYKDRKPPWIRLHKSLLDNYEYQKMSAEARALLPMLWLLASEDNDPLVGAIRHDVTWVAFRLRRDKAVVERAIPELIKGGFIRLVDDLVVNPDLQGQVVYFVLDRQRSLVKVGYSSNINIRLGRLKSEFGEHLELIGTKAGTRILEFDIHKRLAEYRVNNSEWFQWVTPVISEVESQLHEVPLGVPSETETETEYTETEYSSCSAILEDLNKKAGTKYRARSQATRRLIQSRLSEGFTIEDFRTVHTKKCQQWIGTEFEKYLRPSTLYQPSKFEGYLNEKNRAGFDKKNDRNMRVIAGWEPDEVSGQGQVSKGDGETGPDIPEAVGA